LIATPSPAPPPELLDPAALIHIIRSQQVMLDSTLATLYGVPTKALNQAVRRNPERFPPDFMFQLTKEEARYFFEVTNCDLNPEAPRGGRRYQPYVFTEQGVAMLSSVLKSPRAVQVNISIMRTFVKLRQLLAGHEELASLVAKHDWQIGELFSQLQLLLEPPATQRLPIGFPAGRP
jgi:hypothetical protein